jgi:predicted permease
MEEQLDKELRFHLEQRESALIARGLSPTEARREARLALGGPEQVKENCRDARGTRWAEELVQDTRYALRGFRQKPGFVAITLLILALGIGATTVMFTVVNSVLLRPLPFREPERLVVLHGFTKADFGEFSGFSYPDFTYLQHAIRSLDIAAWTYSTGTVSAPGQPEHVDGRQISAQLFPILRVVPSFGRGFRTEEDRPGAMPVAIISYDMWQRRFASDRAALGQKLTFDGKAYDIIGIAPPGFQLSGEADVFTLLGQSTDPRMRNREARFSQVIGRLARGLTLNQAQAELTLISRHLAQEYPAADAGLSVRVHPLLQGLVSDVRGTLWLLLAAIGLVLLIACVNIASLFLTRAIARERELAMRTALGASRGRLVRQCMTESAVLGLGGGLFGIVLAALSVRPFVALWPGNLPRGTDSHRLARPLFRSGHLVFLRPAVRANAGFACSHASARRGAALGRTQHQRQLAPSAQSVRHIGDRACFRSARLGWNARSYSVAAVFSESRLQSTQRADRALRNLAERHRQSAPDTARVAGRTRSRSACSRG